MPPKTPTLSWHFSCGHNITVVYDQSLAVFKTRGILTKNRFSGKCPTCNDTEIKAKAKKEKSRRQDEKAFALYRNQAETIRSHMEESDSDGELDAESRADFRKLLQNCQCLWAKKVKEGLLRQGKPEGEELKPLLQTLTDLKEKIDLILIVEDLNLKSEEGKKKYGSTPENVQKAFEHREKWKELNVALGDRDTLEPVKTYHEQVFKVWTEAVDLLAEEEKLLKEKKQVQLSA